MDPMMLLTLGFMLILIPLIAFTIAINLNKNKKR